MIAIMLDGVLSGTVQTARLAARQVMSEIPGSDIRVFDSLTAACPISGMAMEVLAYAETGATMDELEEYLKGLIERTETYFSVNTFRLSAERRPYRRRRRFSRQYSGHTSDCAHRYRRRTGRCR